MDIKCKMSDVAEILNTAVYETDYKFTLLKNNEVDKQPDGVMSVLSFLNKQLEYIKSFESRLTGNGVKDITHYGKYSLGCKERFEELIEKVSKLVSDGVEYFVYKQPITFGEGNAITPDKVDVLVFNETEKTVPKYKLVLNKNHRGVHLEFDSNVVVYGFKSVTDDSVLEGIECKLCLDGKIEDVKLENVFKLMNRGYLFDKDDVATVQELVKEFKLYLCIRCGKSYYLPEGLIEKLNKCGYPLPTRCQFCRKERRENREKLEDNKNSGEDNK